MLQNESGSGRGKLKVVVFCEIQKPQLDLLHQARFEVICHEERAVDLIKKELEDADGAVSGVYVQFDEELLQACPHLRVIGRMGVGVDNIDLEAATRHNVQVVNTPLPIIEPVAEHTLALMLALSRNLIIGDKNVREGKFRHSSDAPFAELKGKTLGIIGFGNTGKRLAEIAKNGLGMNVIFYDPVPVPSETQSEMGVQACTFEEVLAQGDYISLHVSLSEKTVKLFSHKEFQLMKDSSRLINCSRGPVVDEEALIEALKSQTIAGAAIDVFEQEPPNPDNPLLSMPNVILTPHRAGQSSESLIGCSRVAEDVVRVLRGEEPRFPVNNL